MKNMVERARANEKCTQDSDSNPSVSSDVLEDTAIGVGELDTKKAQCWFETRILEEQSTTRHVTKRHS